MATSGKAWREKTTEEVTFSTGNTAKLRKPDLMNVLSADGGIPDVFVEFVQKIDFSKNDIPDSELIGIIKDLPMLWRYVDRMVIGAFVEPRIVENPQADDEIAIEDVDMTEKIETFTWVMKGVAPLVKLGQSFLRK